MRSFLTALSVLCFASTCIIWNAFYQKKQFYPAVIYMLKYRPFFVILLLQCIGILFIFAKLLCWIFFGTLNRTEIDNILSRSWYTFFDMCLVFAFFQDELDAHFLFLFIVILFIKAYHWLLEERVDHMERTPIIRLSFHVRMTCFMALLLVTDVYGIYSYYWGRSPDDSLASMAVGAEYYILLFGLLSTLMRYILQTVDSLRDTQFEQKSVYLLYVDVIVDFLRLSFYWEFAPLLWSRHPFPLFIIRPIYLTIRSLKKSIRDILMSRRAIRLMNTIFKDVTHQELSSLTDTVCIICREDMHTSLSPERQPSVPQDAPTPDPSSEAAQPSERPFSPGFIKKLPCSHIFHAACLRLWFQRQQTCPTCRMDVIRQAEQQRDAQPVQATHPRPRQEAAQATESPPITTTTTTTTPAPNLPPGFGSTVAAGGYPFCFTPPTTSTASPALYPMPYPYMPMLPLMMPPLLIPGHYLMPAGLPSTMPPAPEDLATPAEEAELRESVEARIRTLRQISVLLQAAILQMNSYLLATTQTPLSAVTEATKGTGISTELFSPSGDTKPEGEVNIPKASEPPVEDLIKTTDDDALESLRKRRIEKLDLSSTSG